MTKGYLSRAALLSALTTLEEQDIHEPLLGGPLRIRELTAAERQQAQQAAWAAGTADNPDNAIYRALIVRYGVIDPATKDALLSAEDVASLAHGREEAVKRVAVAILSLSEALPGSLKSGDPAADQGE